MKRVVTRLLVPVMFMLLMAAPAGIAVSASATPASVVAAEHPATAPNPTTTPNPTAPTGVTLTPEQQSDRAKQKLFIGIVAAVLLAVVIVGRSTRRKIRKKKQGAVSS